MAAWLVTGARRGGVTDLVDGGDRHDGTGNHDERARQRIDAQVDAGQREQPGQVDVERVPGERGTATGDASRSGQRGEDPGERDPDASRSAQPGDGGQPACGGGDRKGGPGDAQSPCHAHFPVTVRSAATMSSGAGGQPGTARSTGTTSDTAPSTP